MDETKLNNYVITTGGKVMEEAKLNNYVFITLKDTWEIKATHFGVSVIGDTRHTRFFVNHELVAAFDFTGIVYKEGTAEAKRPL